MIMSYNPFDDDELVRRASMDGRIEAEGNEEFPFDFRSGKGSLHGFHEDDGDPTSGCKKVLGQNEDQMKEFDPLAGDVAIAHVDQSRGLSFPEQTGAVDDKFMNIMFDTKQVEKSFEEQCSCPICFETYCSAPPRQVLCCGYCKSGFCKSCLEDSLKTTNNSCPLCRSLLDETKIRRNREMEKKVAHMPSECVKCGKTMARGELELHEEVCQGVDSMVEKQTQLNEQEQWACSKCTYRNHIDLNYCEICETMREDGGTRSVPIASSNGNRPRKSGMGHDLNGVQPVVENPTPTASLQHHGSSVSSWSSSISMETWRGTILMYSKSKVVFRKWKPVRYQLDPGFLKLYQIGGDDDGEILINLPLHAFVNIGAIIEITDRIVMKRRDEARNNRLVRKKSSPARIFMIKLVENPLEAAKLNSSLLRKAQFDPNFPEVDVIASLGMESQEDMSQFVDILSQLVASHQCMLRSRTM